MRSEIRKLAAEAGVDPEQAVAEHMELAHTVARTLNIAPNSVGDYVLPAEIDKPFVRVREGNKSLNVIQDFALQMPVWTKPLIDEYRTGEITEVRKNLVDNLAQLKSITLGQ
jgi:hypothetical protein